MTKKLLAPLVREPMLWEELKVLGMSLPQLQDEQRQFVRPL